MNSNSCEALKKEWFEAENELMMWLLKGGFPSTFEPISEETRPREKPKGEYSWPEIKERIEKAEEKRIKTFNVWFDCIKKHRN